MPGIPNKGLNFMGVERDFTHPGGGILKTVCDRSGGHTQGDGGAEQICATVTVTHKAATEVLFAGRFQNC